jgi:hypothetical protein
LIIFKTPQSHPLKNRRFEYELTNLDFSDSQALLESGRAVKNRKRAELKLAKKLAPKLHTGLSPAELADRRRPRPPHAGWEHPQFNLGCVSFNDEEDEDPDDAMYEGTAAVDFAESDDDADDGDADKNHVEYVPSAPFEVLPCPHEAPKGIPVGARIVFFFFSPFDEWFEGVVTRVSGRKAYDNVEAKFDDGLSVLTLDSATYGVNETWVLIRQKAADDDGSFDGSTDEERKAPTPSPSLSPAKKKRRAGECP